jgi:DNA gyrase subunit A
MEMVLMSAGGQVIRQSVNMVRQTGRNTQGVRVMSLNEGDTVVSMACMVIQHPAAADGGNGEPHNEAVEAAAKSVESDIDEMGADETVDRNGADDGIDSEPDPSDAD